MWISDKKKQNVVYVVRWVDHYEGLMPVYGGHGGHIKLFYDYGEAINWCESNNITYHDFDSAVKIIEMKVN